jgi:hypothetical protein
MSSGQRGGGVEDGDVARAGLAAAGVTVEGLDELLDLDKRLGPAPYRWPPGPVLGPLPGPVEEGVGQLGPPGGSALQGAST